MVSPFPGPFAETGQNSRPDPAPWLGDESGWLELRLDRVLDHEVLVIDDGQAIDASRVGC
jgi:hypothetical protein